MARHVCFNGTLDDAKYSSPMPWIGLYVALATLVCLLFILFDIISGLRNRKQWLPCRLFSLNSLTLTLLAIAAKIPVDLTTTMPTTHDQLSKLTGTTLICVCMGFLMPSLGINRKSESWTNMVSLGILVVTIVVNICIQLHTGVILLFRAEHIAILCCMMLLLCSQFCSTLDINSQKEVSVDQNKDLLKKGRGSMLKRLKLCYLKAYHSNPQLELCKDIDSVLVGVLCIVSSILVVQAAFRSFLDKRLMFQCKGSSSYEWSIWVILATQIATIVIASLGTSYRLVNLAGYMKFDTMGLLWASKGLDMDIKLKNPLFDNPRRPAKDASMLAAIYPMFILVMFIEVLIIFPSAFFGAIFKVCIESCCSSVCKPKVGDNSSDIREYRHLIEEGEVEEWILKKGVKAMKKWMEMNKFIAPQYFTDLIMSKSSPTEVSLSCQLKDLADRTKGYEVSSLSLVLLVRIATISMPSSLSGSLIDILNEFFEVIDFVEKKMNSSSFENKKKSKLAKAAWISPNSREHLHKIFKVSNFEATQLDQALETIEKLKEALPLDVVREEFGIITNFIQHRDYESIEELHDYMKRLFVDMLNEFLTQLPSAICKEITESTPEDYERVIRFSLKLLCKVESLEAFVPWSYPIGTNIQSLVTN